MIGRERRGSSCGTHERHAAARIRRVLFVAMLITVVTDRLGSPWTMCRRIQVARVHMVGQSRERAVREAHQEGEQRHPANSLRAM